MLKNLTSVSSKFYEDQALVLMAFGGFGRYVLSLLHQGFLTPVMKEHPS